MQPPSRSRFYASRATRSVEEAVWLSPHLPGLPGPAGLGTLRRVAHHRLPRFRRASSLHRSRCEFALDPDAKTRWSPSSSHSARLSGDSGKHSRALSVSPSEDSRSTHPARDEVLPLLPFERQEAYGRLGFLFDPRLGLFGTVPRGKHETALLFEDLLKLFVSLRPAGIRIAELGGLVEHVLLDLPQQSSQPFRQFPATHKLLLPRVPPDQNGLPLLDILRPELDAYRHAP